MSLYAFDPKWAYGREIRMDSTVSDDVIEEKPYRLSLLQKAGHCIHARHHRRLQRYDTKTGEYWVYSREE